MGRQIALAATLKDEKALLTFIRTNAEVSLIESFAPSIDELWVAEFSTELTGHQTYKIWNKAYEWNPTYAQVGAKAHDPKSIGNYYVSNTHVAPLIEFSRSDVSQEKYGRIYWAKDFSAPDGVVYDMNKFSLWYDSIVKWIKKFGRRHDQVYFLPDAYLFLSRRSPNNLEPTTQTKV